MSNVVISDVAPLPLLAAIIFKLLNLGEQLLSFSWLTTVCWLSEVLALSSKESFSMKSLSLMEFFLANFIGGS
jgi:hypothetical protein